MSLEVATSPDTSGLLPRLGLTDLHPLGWLHMSPELREAECQGLVMVYGRPRADGRRFVVAKTAAGVREWRDLTRESAERMRQFPVLDATPREEHEHIDFLRGLVIQPRGARSYPAPPHGIAEHYRRMGSTVIEAPSFPVEQPAVEQAAAAEAPERE